MDLTPVFRLEYFIVAAANGTPCDLEPIFNEEKYLHAIAGASVDLPMPIGRTQEYLAKLAGMDVEIPDKPIYRTEYYLAHMIDSTVECPAPIFREEMFYYEWASNEYVTISGNPVSFTAKAAPLRQLSVAFSPVQSLNGYDAPWPAGGGKNKIDQASLEQGGINGVDGQDYTALSERQVRTKGYFPVQAETTYTLSASISFTLVTTYVFFYDSSENFIGSADKTSSVLNFTFTTPANAVFMRFKVYSNSDGVTPSNITNLQLELGSTATSYAPYSNICPISGWTGVNVWQTGINAWDGTWEVGSIFSSNGENEVAPANWRTVGYVPCRPNTEYYIASVSGGTNAIRPRFYDANKNYIGYSPKSGIANCGNTIVTPDNAYFVRWAPIAANIPDHDISLNYPSTDREYHAYNPLSRSISISLGQTVYSGYVDVVTGVVTVDMAKVTLDGSQTQQNSKYDGTYNAIARWNLSVPAKAVSSASSKPNALSDKLRVIGVSFVGSFAVWANDESLGFTFTLSQDGTRVGIAIPKSEGITSAATMNTWLSNNPVTVVYELATPQTIQLTPQEVESLAGDNTMWSNANQPITVEYRSN